ncbi:MAG TPA: WecB/TagA/CpsF family glycosyltransferase [bacterium]|jgi:N-acetylglucosaminyldiphosphoundecaprenol N-acetyl-beta-D-mannosaminyltransferase
MAGTAGGNAFNIAGVRVDDVTRDDVLAAVERFVADDGLHRIVTPNVDHILHAQRDRMFKQAVNSAALSIPDGKWLQRGARLLGVNIREGIAGRLLVEPMCELAARHGWSVYILASIGNIAERAADTLRKRYPGLKIIMARSPSMRFGQDAAETAELLRELNALRPDILFLGLGAPKSEKWLYEHREQIPARVAIGVGYAFDILAGRIAECPRWITAAGMEWAYRLLKEPRRLWKRYLVRDPQFFGLLIKQRLSGGSTKWVWDASAQAPTTHP